MSPILWRGTMWEVSNHARRYVTVEASEHNHALLKGKLQALHIRSVIRDKTTKTRDGPTLIIAESSADVSHFALTQFQR